MASISSQYVTAYQMYFYCKVLKKITPHDFCPIENRC